MLVIDTLTMSSLHTELVVCGILNLIDDMPYMLDALVGYAHALQAKMVRSFEPDLNDGCAPVRMAVPSNRVILHM